jgi:type I restriction enzyme R subunit
MKEAGYDQDQIAVIRKEVEHYEKVRAEVKLASGDYIDLKKYEPAMRALMDRYISASESEKLSAFDDKSLVDLIVEKGPDAINSLPDAVTKSEVAVAEIIENNVRKLITDEMPTNPKYYQRMSELLDELVKKRKRADLEYRKYLEEIIALSKKVKNPSESESYPNEINTRGKQALYDNLGKDQVKAESVHNAIISSRYDSWRGDTRKERAIKIAIQKVLPEISDQESKDLFEIIKNQNEY